MGGLFEYVCTLEDGQQYPQGTYTIDVDLVDLAGNTRSEILLTDRPLIVDTQRPQSPAVDIADVIRYERSPWGSIAGDGTPQFSLSGGAGAAGPCDPDLPVSIDEPCHWVIALAQQDADLTGELGRTGAEDDGGFPTFSLAAVDVPILWVIAVDAAGNASDADDDLGNGVQAVAVRDITWIATLSGKINGSTVANPHRLVITPTFRPSLGQDAARTVEPDLVPSLGERLQFIDGDSVTAESQRIWTQRFSTSLKPPERTEHATAYDSERGRVVMFGGRDSVGELQDVWEWDGVRWEQLFGEGDLPSPRAGHAMAFDAARGRVVMFGGLTINGSLSGQTWLWNGAAWVNAEPASSPPARRYHRMEYFPERGSVVLFGGLAETELDDIWEWDGGHLD